MTCYRHPEREAYVRCQRCERFICPDCQTASAVGFLCPEDAGVRVVTPTVKRTRNGLPITTSVVLAVTVVVYLLQLIPGIYLTEYLAYVPIATTVEPWRMITAGFVHDTNFAGNPSAILHVVFNMYLFVALGRQLEPQLGSWRFALLYLASIFGGSVAVLIFGAPTGWVIGASGGVFGVMGAFLVVLRSLNLNSSSIVSLIAINLVFSFAVPGVSWQAHVGGLVTGVALALVFANTRNSNQVALRNIGTAAVILALVAATAYGITQLPPFV
jgi:membrane associated rhomboid family serine protease